MMTTTRRGRRLPAGFFSRDPLIVAPELLGKVLEHDGRAVRIVEVEAYCGPDDPASHAFRGQTPRTATMFGPPGRLYVYFSYGMHWCANVVAHRPGEVGAVLVRAGAPLRGIDEMQRARPAARTLADLASGPAKLCQALGIDGTFDGVDLRAADGPVALRDDGTAPPTAPVAGPRVGISVAVEHPWRFSVPGDPNRSKPW
ncbi:MAG: DNA-3-methyladenine glycosylase [Acidimicrobiales bacterium]|nr:DNA-3-methyladenine glycosylase [Acidimicrobiales bacterium]